MCGVAYAKQLKLKEEMKKTMMHISALVTMLFVSGGMLNMASTAYAQELTIDHTQQDTTIVKLDDLYKLAYLNITAEPRVDYIYVAKPKPVAKVAETPGVAAEEPAEEVVAAVPNKPYERVIVKWAGRNRYGKYTDQCAAHANGRLTRAGYYSNGHAYQIPAHFPSVINGYKSVKIPDLSKVSSDKRYATVLNMHRQAADYVKENLDISKLVPGKYYVVNMYYSTSPYMLQFFYSARKQGTGNYGTHIGVLYYNTEHEAWIVEHNIHGHVYYDALVSILGGFSNPNKYGVTSISRVSK